MTQAHRNGFSWLQPGCTWHCARLAARPWRYSFSTCWSRLISLNNAWARKLRDLLVKHTGRAAEVLFPRKRWAQIAYDIVTFILLGIGALLVLHHAAIWQISLSIFLFFIALLIISLNRKRLDHIRRRK
jgi:ABC-type multidrug transport system fused ATPase/permease subunit